MAAIDQLDDLLNPTLAGATQQWDAIHDRQPYEPGKRQVDFTPVEVVLSHAASLVVDHRKYGSTTSDSASQPVQLLALLFRRPPSSVLSKMANLDGSRPHGARFDHAAGLVWSVDRDRFDRAYAVVVLAARRSGLGPSDLPDFLVPGWRA